MQDVEPTIAAPGQVQPASERTGPNELSVKEIDADVQSFGLQSQTLLKADEPFAAVVEAGEWPLILRDQNFVVIQSIDDAGAIVIYKARKTSDPRAQGRNEVVFYEHFSNDLFAALPEHLREKIVIPKMLQHHTIAGDPENRVSFILTFFEGEALGELHRATSQNLAPDDLYAIADFLKTMQHQGKGFVDSPDSPFVLTGENRVDMYKKYHKNIVDRKQGFDVALGADAAEYYKKLQVVLDNAAGLFSDDSLYFFTQGNFHFADILKNKEDQLCMLDFERVCASNNPAHDYAALLAALRDTPKLQEDFLNYIVDSNGATVDERIRFKEYLRMAYLFSRGLGELNDWNTRLQKAESSEEIALCKDALNKEALIMKDAIDDKGIWASEKIESRMMVK